jgi:hypothetical protein
VSAWALGAWRAGAWAGTAWAEGAPVEVPNVVGLSQADATTALEAAGFVVAATTAASSTVPVGHVISQEPVGGAMATAGSTVTIVVSTGDLPTVNPLLHGTRRKNVQFRPLKKPESDFVPEVLDPPTPAEVKAAVRGRGVDLGLLPKPTPAPEPHPTPKVSASEPHPTPKVSAPTAAPPIGAPAPSPVAVSLAMPTSREAVEAVQALAEEMKKANQMTLDQVAAISKQLTEAHAVIASLAALQTEVRQQQQARDKMFDVEEARRTRNRKKAEEVTRRLLDS